jgi:hypothetical protein
MGPTSNEKRIELELKNEDHQKERKGRKKRSLTVSQITNKLAIARNKGEK